MTDIVTPIRKSLADDLRGQITEIAARASEKDRDAVAKLIKRAEGASYSCEIVHLTPGMCALLFLFHNSHNRPWSGAWSVEFTRRMKDNAWKKNSMSIGFYKDGMLEDGQHRLAAAAISGTELTIPMVLGVDHDSVDTIDSPKRRDGAAHAFLDGIADPSKKQAIVKAAASYFIRRGDVTAALKSEAEIKKAIESNDDLLVKAIEIGSQSRENIHDPVLKETIASTVVYIMLKSAWPVQTIRERLAFFQQAGGSVLGDSDPFFVAVNLLEAGHKRTARGERLSTAKELGIVIFALIEAEKGTKAVHKKRFQDAIKKTVPDPCYPVEAAQQAAE